MITTENINEILDINESFQLYGALKSRLFDNKKREKMFNEFLKLETDLSYDWFTNYFQEEQSNRKNMMQDYTPDCICKLLKELNKNQENKSTFFDCCSGIGGLTISMWLDNKNKTFYLEELSDNSMMVLLFNLSIRGINAYIRHGDVLTNEFKAIYKLTNSGQFSDIELIENIDNDFKVDTIISNPPYSLKFDRIEEYKYDKRFANYGIPPKSKSDYAFILHGLSHLNENGIMYFILPHGILFRGSKEQEIRKNLINDNLIDTIIGMPENLFLNTTIPTCIMILKKNRNDNDILFVDGSNLFYKKGKNNFMDREHLNKIVSAYQLRENIDKLSHVATLEEIKENDYNLNIPRYVDTYEEQEPIDLEKQINELSNIENKIHEIELSLSKQLRQIEGPNEYNAQRDKLASFMEQKKHKTSTFINDSINWFQTFEKQLSDIEIVNVLDVAKFERSKKNKVYPKGSIAIQVSATRGQLNYLKEDNTVSSKYGVFIVDETKINPRYLYYLIEMTISDFLKKYQTGLNINPEIFLYYKISCHKNKEIQNMICQLMDSMQEIINLKEKNINHVKEVKEFHLDGMFPK